MEQLKTQHVTPVACHDPKGERGMCERSAIGACVQLPRRVTKCDPAGGFRKGAHGKTAIILAEDETNPPERDTLTAYRLEHRNSEEQFWAES